MKHRVVGPCHQRTTKNITKGRKGFDFDYNLISLLLHYNEIVDLKRAWADTIIENLDGQYADRQGLMPIFHRVKSQVHGTRFCINSYFDYRWVFKRLEAFGNVHELLQTLMEIFRTNPNVVTCKHIMFRRG